MKEAEKRYEPERQLPPADAILTGLSAAWPICLGYLPIGLALGVLAQKAGLTPVDIGLMSVVVFAGIRYCEVAGLEDCFRCALIFKTFSLNQPEACG